MATGSVTHVRTQRVGAGYVDIQFLSVSLPIWHVEQRLSQTTGALRTWTHTVSKHYILVHTIHFNITGCIVAFLICQVINSKQALPYSCLIHKQLLMRHHGRPAGWGTDHEQQRPLDSSPTGDLLLHVIPHLSLSTPHFLSSPCCQLSNKGITYNMYTPFIMQFVQKIYLMTVQIL